MIKIGFWSRSKSNLVKIIFQLDFDQNPQHPSPRSVCPRGFSAVHDRRAASSWRPSAPLWSVASSVLLMSVVACKHRRDTYPTTPLLCRRRLSLSSTRHRYAFRHRAYATANHPNRIASDDSLDLNCGQAHGRGQTDDEFGRQDLPCHDASTQVAKTNDYSHQPRPLASMRPSRIAVTQCSWRSFCRGPWQLLSCRKPPSTATPTHPVIMHCLRSRCLQ